MHTLASIPSALPRLGPTPAAYAGELPGAVSQQRIWHLDAWRFIAVSLVMLGHAIAYSNLGAFLASQFSFGPLGRLGSLGVLVFFFISGFVITRGLIQEQSSSGSVCLRAFYLRRGLRILPPLWLYLAVLTALAVGGVIDTTLEQIGKSAMFLCNLQFLGGCSWHAGHTWSLAYEEQFYLLFPFLFLSLGLAGRPRTALFLTVAAILGALLCRQMGMEAGADHLRYVSMLLTGCAAALFQQHRQKPWPRLSVVSWLGIAVLVAGVPLMPYPLDGYLRIIVYPPGIALLVLGTPLAHPWVQAFFHHPWSAYLGRISYTAYLWQQLANALWPGLAAWWTLVLLIAVWWLAHLSWKWLELPLIEVANRWSARIKQNVPPNLSPITAQ